MSLLELELMTAVRSNLPVIRDYHVIKRELGERLSNLLSRQEDLLLRLGEKQTCLVKFPLQFFLKITAKPGDRSLSGGNLNSAIRNIKVTITLTNKLVALTGGSYSHYLWDEETEADAGEVTEEEMPLVNRTKTVFYPSLKTKKWWLIDISFRCFGKIRHDKFVLS